MFIIWSIRGKNARCGRICSWTAIHDHKASLVVRESVLEDEGIPSTRPQHVKPNVSGHSEEAKVLFASRKAIQVVLFDHPMVASGFVALVEGLLSVESGSQESGKL